MPTIKSGGLEIRRESLFYGDGREVRMALIKWDDNLSVNVAEIDGQHRGLIAMINELHDAMKTGKGRDIMEKIVNSLVVYAALHFRTEEKYFVEFGYPDTENHKMEHAAFVDKVSNFKDELEDRKLSLTIDMMDFLGDWLQHHIMGTDKKYTGFFNENGLR